VYQWDRNHTLKVDGLNLIVAPEVHFHNSAMDKAIVKQAELIDGTIIVKIPNSILQYDLPINAHIGIYEGDTFKVIEKIIIPIIAKKRPADYQLENDDEVYSFEGLKNAINNRVTLGQFNADKKVLNARIDTIIANKNNTEGNSELVDVRVDVDGTVHGSAGSAVRTQNAILRTYNEGLIAPSFILSDLLFERGSWNHNDVKSDGEKNRIRTVGAISFPYDVTIYLNDGFQTRGYWCDESGKSTEFFSWLTTPIIVPANQRLKLVIARLTEDSNEIADITEFVNTITVKSHFKSNFDRVSFVLDNMNSPCFTLNPDDFMHGWIEGWNNGIFNVNPKYRVATPDTMSFPYDIIIRANPGFRFALNYWNNGEFASDELWQTEFFVPANQHFKMMISRSPEDSEEVVDVIELVNNVYLESGELDRKVDRLNETVGSSQPINKTVRNINHRGDNRNYPENTLIAFKHSKANGFNFVETDVRFTADNIPVLLHDETINRTGRKNDGSKFEDDIYISDIPYSEVSEYDFGIYKNESFAGTKIPTFDEFIKLCRRLGLHPYIEIEGEITDVQAEILIDIVNNSGLLNHVTWITFSYESLLRILEKNPSARVGLNCITSDGLTDNQINYLGKIKSLTNNVFVHVDMNSVEKCVEDARAYDVPLEVWCPNTEAEIINLPDYVSGVTSDLLLADEIIRENILNDM
jgi:glycerophosphoryl diester phosphodiesterase